MTAHEMPGNPFKLKPGEMNNLMRSWGCPESLIDKITKLGIYPWTMKGIPAKLEHMFAHAL